MLREREGEGGSHVARDACAACGLGHIMKGELNPLGLCSIVEKPIRIQSRILCLFVWDGLGLLMK